jgi:hypothetical protein
MSIFCCDLLEIDTFHCSERYRGERIQDCKNAWKTVSRGGGCPGMYRIAFRRTAPRDVERARASCSVAMKVTGHRSEGVYRRYAVVSDADLKDALKDLTSMSAETNRQSSVVNYWK